MNISVIVVNYKSRHLLSKFISSIQEKLSGISFEIIIINNDKDSLLDFISDEKITIINAPSNLGFGKACNLGANKAKGRVLFFLNPDTEIIEFNYDTIWKKIQLSHVGILTPNLILPDGKTQPWSYGDEFNFWTLIKNNLGLNKISDQAKENPDWVSGAAFLIKKELFEKVKGFDEKFFMYFEDIDLCKRIRTLNYSLLRLERFRVLHVGGQSYDDCKLQKSHYYESQDYYFRKHFGFVVFLFIKAMRKIILGIRKND